MTPNDIEILIHCHVSPVRHPRYDAPAVQSALLELKANGLIADNCMTTEKGVAHINALCNLPFPVCKWVTPQSD